MLLTLVFGQVFTTWIPAVAAAPSADAGGPYAIDEGAGVILDASGSSDPDGDPLTFLWDLNDDSVFGDEIGETVSLEWTDLVAFGIDDDGTFPVAVRVSDGTGDSDTASGTIEVTDVAPVLVTTGATTVVSGEPYTLNLEAIGPRR